MRAVVMVPLKPPVLSDLDAFLATWIALGFAFLFGALWGSFFNVCIARIPLGKSVVSPGSHCFACGTNVKAYDNIPLLSYLWLRGRCRACGARFSARYLGVELLTASLSAVIFWLFVQQDPGLETGVRLARYCVFFAFAGALVVLSFIDLDTHRLPDVITLPSIPLFFVLGFGTHFAPWQERAIGLVAGYVAVRLISDGYYYLRGREGLGLGDGKLLSMVGALLGWKALPFVVFVASLLGVLVSLPLLMLGARRGQLPQDPDVDSVLSEAAGPTSEVPEDRVDVEPLRYVQVPFGPFLAMSSLGYLLLYDFLMPWVMYLLGA